MIVVAGTVARRRRLSAVDRARRTCTGSSLRRRVAEMIVVAGTVARRRRLIAVDRARRNFTGSSLRRREVEMTMAAVPVARRRSLLDVVRADAASQRRSSIQRKPPYTRWLSAFGYLRIADKEAGGWTSNPTTS